MANFSRSVDFNVSGVTRLSKNEPSSSSSSRATAADTAKNNEQSKYLSRQNHHDFKLNLPNTSTTAISVPNFQNTQILYEDTTTSNTDEQWLLNTPSNTRRHQRFIIIPANLSTNTATSTSVSTPPLAHTTTPVLINNKLLTVVPLPLLSTTNNNDKLQPAKIKKLPPMPVVSAMPVVPINNNKILPPPTLLHQPKVEIETKITMNEQQQPQPVVVDNNNTVTATSSSKSPIRNVAMKLHKTTTANNQNKSLNEQRSGNSICGNSNNNDSDNVDSIKSSFIVGGGDDDNNTDFNGGGSVDYYNNTNTSSSNRLISQSDAIHQHQHQQLPSRIPVILTTMPTTETTTTPTKHSTHTEEDTTTDATIMNNNKNMTLSSINCSLPITNSISQTLGVVNLRPKLFNSSMRSVVSAHISTTDHDHQQQMSLQSPTTNRIIRTSSYIFGDSNTKIYSDATSIRSLASIGVGSTDGRKLVIKRVPNSPTEFINIVNPPQLQPPGDADDDSDDSYGYNSDDPDSANLKPRRQHWANKMQFVLACIGYSVGLGNVWRFPYMCYKSGGGVFLVPYFIILIICSTPMLYMELAVGQYTGRGPIGALGQICPLFRGAGLASVVVSFLMSTYYSVIIGYSIYYFFTSMKPEMPWTGCNNRWNSIDCWIPERKNVNMTPTDLARTPSEEFFDKKVLQLSPGIEYPGLMRWELFACLIFAWLLVYFATWKSIKSSAKVRYFTATFPFVLIVVLMGRALTLEGAEDGLRFFFRPKWAELGNANVWINACSQNFNSLGIAFGSMISFASYNKYNNNILYDTLAVSAVNAITSILVGIFAFATLGNLAWELNTTVKDVISDGPGLIFVVYPQVMAKMPYAQLWAVMFFFMLLCLGLNSQFAIVEVVVTSIQDGFPNWIKRNLVYHEVLVLIVCVVSFLFGLPNITQGGMYFFQLMDHYAASISIMFVAFFEMIAISWFYGAGRLSKNVKQMTGKSPALYLKTCWLLCAPLLLISLWIFSLINYQEPTYHNGKYSYPRWAYGIGWAIASLSLVCIPAYAIINILRASGDNLFDKLLNSMKPNIYECHICGEHHCEHDFPEDQYMLAAATAASHQQQETSIVQPKIILKTPPPGHHNQINPPLLTSKNEPNTSVILDDDSSVGATHHIAEETKR